MQQKSRLQNVQQLWRKIVAKRCSAAASASPYRCVFVRFCPFAWEIQRHPAALHLRHSQWLCEILQSFLRLRFPALGKIPEVSQEYSVDKEHYCILYTICQSFLCTFLALSFFAPRSDPPGAAHFPLPLLSLRHCALLLPLLSLRCCALPEFSKYA